MNTVNVYEWPVAINALPRRVGQFDYDEATVWRENSAGRGESVILTDEGRWVLERWTDDSIPGGESEFEYIDAEFARAWLTRNGYWTDDLIPRGPGRPEIGKATTIRLGDELTAAADERATAEGVSRAELVRYAFQKGWLQDG